MLQEEWPDPIGKVEPKGIFWTNGPIGIMMGDIIKKSEEQLVAIDVTGLWSLCAKLSPGSAGQRADWRSGKIEGIKIQQDLGLDLRDPVEERGIQW